MKTPDSLDSSQPNPLSSLLTNQIVSVVCTANGLIVPSINRALPIGERPTLITVNNAITATVAPDVALVFNPDSFKFSKGFLRPETIPVLGPRVLAKTTTSTYRPYSEQEIRTLIAASIDYVDAAGPLTSSVDNDSLVLTLKLLKKYKPAEVRLYGVEYTANNPNVASHFFSFNKKGYVCQVCYAVAAKPYLYEGSLHTCPACHVINRMSFFSFRGGGSATPEKLKLLKEQMVSNVPYVRYSGKPSKLDKVFRRVNV